MSSSVSWILLCTFLVLLMQAGFLWLETGLVRAKSSVNIAIKNMMDFCVSAAVFWAIGFGLMFGAGAGPLIGSEGFLASLKNASAWTKVFFFFQLAFCSTAITIVSGAIAERATFFGYFAIAILGASVIYPVFGHWAWGGLLSGEPTGWLEKAGFIDFAGSTVVHSIGGWIALSAVLVIGPRLGRFSRKRDRFGASDLSLSIAGAFFLWIGWFGFNGGSVLAFDESVPGVLLNTLMAPAAGGLAVMVLFIVQNRRPDVPRMINGVLAGLVAVTANCHIVSIHSALIIGAVGGLICLAAQKLLDIHRIDDAVSAIPVHLAAGIWGTLAVALFGDLSAFHDGAGRWDQFLIQLQGVGTAAVYAFGVSYVGLRIINMIYPLRVTAREELRGLDVSEHGHESAMQILLNELESHARKGSQTRPVSVEPNTRAGVVALRYNRVLDRVRAEIAEKENLLTELTIEKQRAEVANSAKTQFLMNISHELLTPLNAIAGFQRYCVNSSVPGPRARMSTIPS